MAELGRDENDFDFLAGLAGLDRWEVLDPAALTDEELTVVEPGRAVFWRALLGLVFWLGLVAGVVVAWRTGTATAVLDRYGNWAWFGAGAFVMFLLDGVMEATDQARLAWSRGHGAACRRCLEVMASLAGQHDEIARCRVARRYGTPSGTPSAHDTSDVPALVITKGGE